MDAEKTGKGTKESGISKEDEIKNERKVRLVDDYTLCISTI